MALVLPTPAQSSSSLTLALSQIHAFRVFQAHVSKVHDLFETSFLAETTRHPATSTSLDLRWHTQDMSLPGTSRSCPSGRCAVALHPHFARPTFHQRFHPK